jgi:NADH-quinone oxidoreductase subunit L
MFRLIYLTFFNSFRGTEEQKHHLHESPALITVPLIILAILSFIGGAISLPGHSWLNHYLAPLFTKVAHEEHTLGDTEYMLMAIATVGALIGIGIAYKKYLKDNVVPTEDAEITGISKVLYNKYYVDEGYDAIFVKPINVLANFFRDSLEPALGALVFGFGKVTNEIALQGKKVHNGSIGLYLAAFVFGVIAILTYLFLQKFFT